MRDDDSPCTTTQMWASDGKRRWWWWHSRITKVLNPNFQQKMRTSVPAYTPQINKIVARTTIWSSPAILGCFPLTIRWGRDACLVQWYPRTWCPRQSAHGPALEVVAPWLGGIWIGWPHHHVDLLRFIIQFRGNITWVTMGLKINYSSPKRLHDSLPQADLEHPAETMVWQGIYTFYILRTISYIGGV